MSCPRGFVPVDQNAQVSSLIIFEKNGCLEACRHPMRTRQQYIESDKVATIASCTGLAVVVVLLFIWRCKGNHSRRQFIISHFIYISILASIGFLLTGTTGNREAIFCRDKVTPMAQSDGISVCAVQAAILLFTVLASSLAWLSQLIDLYCKLVKGYKSTENYIVRYFVLIYAYPTLATLIFACSGLLGYDGANVFCLRLSSPSSDVDVPLVALFLPIVLIIISGIALLCMITWTIMKAWCRISPSPTPIDNTKRTCLFAGVGPGPDNTLSRAEAGGILRTPARSLYIILLRSFRKGRVSTIRIQQAPESTHAKTRNIRELAGIVGGARDSGGLNNEAAGVADAGSIVVVQENNNINEDEKSFEGARPPSTTSTSNNELLKKRLVATSSLLAFCVLFMFSWAIFLLIKMRMFVNAKMALSNYDSWLDCVKTQFDGETDVSWISVCGEQASVYADRYPTFLAVVVLSTGQSLMVGVILVFQFVDLLKKKKKIFDN